MKVVIIHLDGLGFEYFKKSDLQFTKFLRGPLYRMRIFPGYFSNEVSLFTGLSPKQHHMEDLFVLDPEKNPFKSNLFKLIPNKLIPLIARFYGYKTYIELKIKKDYLKLFVPVAKDHPYNFLNTFPMMLADNNIRFKYLNSFNFSAYQIQEAIRSNDCIYAMNSSFDKLLHKQITPRLIAQYIDDIIKKVYHFLIDNFKDNFCLIILSDHGMIDVKGKINLDKPNIDNEIRFIDSTILRVWGVNNHRFKNPHTILYDSTILPNTQFKYYKKYLAKPGYIFSPNFFQGHNTIKGMHGYDSTHSPHDAFVLIHHPQFQRQNTGNCSIIDIAPTILKIFKIKQPSHMKGVPLI